MIKQVNLLDKVFYIHNKCVYEVTTVSKVYETSEANGWCVSFKAINIIFNDEVIAVDIKELYYTSEEAYKEILKNIKEEISLQEKYVQAAQLTLARLYKEYKCILNKLENEPSQ